MIFSDPITNAFVAIAALQVKHFICDGPLQTLAMVQGKSHYGRPIGLLHALIHAVGTAVVLTGFGVPLALVLKLALLDGALHYHIDFTKENTVKMQGWKASDGPFWWAFTADQTLHHMSYVLLAWLAFKP